MTARDGGYVSGRHKIDDYGGGGFRFAEMSHRGSILALPSGVSAASLTRAADIDEAIIDRALAESGGLDVFVVGTGQDLLPLAAGVRARLRAAGVGCEAMATGAAVRTYNILVDEDRRVGALLIAV